MGISGKSSKMSSVVAALCMVIYIAAIAFGAVRIILNIGERRNVAAKEFEDLTDRASSSAVFLGFMSEAYQETIRDFLNSSETLLGVIITGSDGEYAFERYAGKGIEWTGDSPRFKSGTGFLRKPFYLPLRIEGQRNVTIQAISSYIDNSFLLETLRNVLIAVLATLTLAFITLMAELARKNRSVSYEPGDPAGDPARDTRKKYRPASPSKISASVDQYNAEEEPEIPEIDEPVPQTAEEKETPLSDMDFPESADEEFISEDDDAAETPQGLYTPRGNVGWESYTQDRLASELHRCASFEQDLVFLIMEFRGAEELSDALYRQFAAEAVNFFTMRDMIFEKNENGVSVIIPSSDLEQGMAKSEEFRNRVIGKLPESFKGRTELCIGLSSRSGRLIEAERLIKESSKALEKALEDPASPIVAFKSDPDKYREFISRHHDK